MDKTMTKWEKCLEFHGHKCLGLAIGYRQAVHALEILGVTKSGDEELLAIIETDACGVDAVQVLTGCTIGKGNLIYKDAGKQALTLADRKTDKAVRIVLKPYVLKEDARFQEIRQQIVDGSASPEILSEWGKIQKARVEEFLSLPVDELFKVTEVRMPEQEKARLFSTIICSRCGEPFSEAKARLAEGQVVCSDCSLEYSRGW